MNKKKFTVERLITETEEHRLEVEENLKWCRVELVKRGINHDYTKSGKNLEVLRDCLNGDKDWKEWDDIHLKVEDHHPEYFESIKDMDLLCLLEMVADGVSASKRINKEITWEDQYNFFVERKGFSEELASILANTFIMIDKKDD